MSTEPLFIIGAGGFGREVATILLALGQDTRPAGLVDDDPSELDRQRAHALGLSVVDTVQGLAARRDPFAVAIAVGCNRTRESIEALLGTAPVSYPVIVHPDATVGSGVTLGPGTILAPGARLSTNIVTGRHVHVDQNAVVGHDSTLADFARVNPHGCISGDVRLGSRVLVGASATVLQRLTLADDVVVGAGAVVIRDVAVAGAVLKGVPAR